MYCTQLWRRAPSRLGRLQATPTYSETAATANAMTKVTTYGKRLKSCAVESFNGGLPRRCGISVRVLVAFLFAIAPRTGSASRFKRLQETYV